MKKHYIEEIHKDKNPMYLTKSKLYNSDKNVMVRILSPIRFPVDWKERVIQRDLIEEYNDE